MTKNIDKLEQLLKMLDGQLTLIKQGGNRLEIKQAYEMTRQLTDEQLNKIKTILEND